MLHDQRLLFHGFVLFLLGLATGLVAYRLENLGAGFEAAPWQEALLTASPVAGVLPPIVCGAIAVWGLRRGAHAA